MSRIPLQRRRGFTLIEVMIAVVIAALAVAGLYGVFTTQSRQLVIQDMQGEMNQNLRFAADVVTRSMREAANTSGADVTGPFGVPTSGDVMPVIVSYDADGGNDTDAVSVVFGEPSLMMDTRNDVVESCGTSTLSFRPSANQSKLQQFDSGDLMICFDYASSQGVESYIWSLSAAADFVTGQVSVSPNTSYSDYSVVCPSGENLTPIMSCSKAAVITFYVDDDGDDGIGPGSENHPVLMMDLDQDWPEADDVPLVDNIEDFQLEYCLDDEGATEGDGSTDCSIAASWDDDIDTDDADILWMIRASFIARSSRQEQSDRYTNTRPALANRSGATAADSYFRRVISTEVSLRNVRSQGNM